MSISRNLSIFADTVATSGNAVSSVTIPVLNGSTTLSLQTGGTTGLYLDASQNVGIGTTSPSAKLSVLGSSYFQYPGGAGTYGTNTYFYSGSGDVTLAVGTSASGNAYQTVSTNHSFVFGTNNTERMRIDSSGNVGIATSSPTYKLQVGTHNGYNDQFSVYNDGTFSTGGVNIFNYYNNTTNICGIKFASVSTTTGAILFYNNNGSGVTESGRFDVNGNLNIGATNAFGKLSTLAGNGNVAWGCTNTSGTALYYAAIFYNNGTSLSGCGSIVVSGTTTAFNTSSDYRMKENVQPMTTGLTTIAALKPVTYDWISTKEKGEGFIAHELAKVIPHAVTGEKDAVDENGKIMPQGVDYSKIVVHLVAALQELTAEVTALKAKVGV